MDLSKSSAAPPTAKVEGKDRCLLCGKPATVCEEHAQKKIPDEVLGMMDQLSALHSAPKVWDHIVHQLAARNLPAPHFASTRVDYIPIDSEASLYGEAAPSNVQPLVSRTGVLPSFLTTASQQKETPDDSSSVLPFPRASTPQEEPRGGGGEPARPSPTAAVPAEDPDQDPR